jgi:type I restriction enzyme S subunit
MMAEWQSKTLIELCDVFADGDWVESKDQSPEGIRLIQTGNVGQGVFKDRGEKARYISEATFHRLRCTEIFEDDCLISRLPDPVGRSCLLPDTGERMITAVDCTIVRFKRNLLIPEFFNYYSQSCSYLQDVESETSGTTRKRISRSKLGETSIPVPPLPEQQRIVNTLDETFDEIAVAKGNAEKNLANARALFESQLQTEFAEAWQTGELVQLADLAKNISDGDHMPPPKASSGVPFITIGNIHKGTRTIDFSDTFKVPHDYYNSLKPNKKPIAGDVLYTVTGSFGIPVLVSDGTKFCFQRHIGLVRPKSGIDSKWLYYLLMSPQVFKQANEGATGTAQKTVSLKILRGFQVPKISLSQQRLCVEKFDSLSTGTQRLESIYQHKLAALDALKKSLLNKAFSGEI